MTLPAGGDPGELTDYRLPCDHCGGTIRPAFVGHEQHCFGWICINCACVWTLDFRLLSSGSECPVFATVKV
jgi:hypothetical protein